ncbi:MAG: metal ABC transporter substrate-binding protein [Candidatus Omnitrophica bacterium]|nr:metal ABC transporter substrate-binding protein [Candidatus Omnitrophota bacterium]
MEKILGHRIRQQLTEHKMKRISALLLFTFSFCFAASIEVVSTTSQIAAVVSEIGKDCVNIAVLIPPGICPGHYEIKPNDIKKLWNGGVLFYHGWEGFIDDISKSVPGAGPRMFKIDVSGSWLVPEIQIKAAEKIADVLRNIDPERKKFYETNLEFYKNQMKELDRKIKNFVYENNLIGIKVVCSEMQKYFLKYLKFDVIDCFGRDEEITPGEIARLIDSIKNHKVKIIVSNLQSGTSTGEMLAKRTSVPHVIISNFPGGFENTKTIEATIMKNINLLKTAAYNNTNR